MPKHDLENLLNDQIGESLLLEETRVTVAARGSPGSTSGDQ